MFFVNHPFIEQVNYPGSVDSSHGVLGMPGNGSVGHCHEFGDVLTVATGSQEHNVDPRGTQMHTTAVQTSYNGSSCSAGPLGHTKRRRMDDPYMDDVMMSSPGKVHSGFPLEYRNIIPGKRFLNIRRNGFIYHSEDWKPRGATMYLPLLEDILINTHNIDQISFEADQFFLADEKGNYVGAKPGNSMHLWRYDNKNKKLYISRSVLFIREQDHKDVRLQLEFL